MPADEPPPAPEKPSIDSLHRDLAFANGYRQELVKSLLLIAGALFAFSVTFRPELAAPRYPLLFWFAWAGLAVSMVGGFLQLGGWELFYASYQKFDWKLKKPNGKAYRERVHFWIIVAKWAQGLGFVIGVACLGAFTALNLDSPKASKAETRVIGTQ